MDTIQSGVQAMNKGTLKNFIILEHGKTGALQFVMQNRKESASELLVVSYFDCYRGGIHCIKRDKEEVTIPRAKISGFHTHRIQKQTTTGDRSRWRKGGSGRRRGRRGTRRRRAGRRSPPPRTARWIRGPSCGPSPPPRPPWRRTRCRCACSPLPPSRAQMTSSAPRSGDGDVMRGETTGKAVPWI